VPGGIRDAVVDAGVLGLQRADAAGCVKRHSIARYLRCCALVHTIFYAGSTVGRFPNVIASNVGRTVHIKVQAPWSGVRGLRTSIVCSLLCACM